MNASNLDIAIEKHYDRLFTKYYHPHHDIFNKYEYMHVDGMGERAIKFYIENMLSNGRKIKTGYASTSIRGIHRRYIFW